MVNKKLVIIVTIILIILAVGIIYINLEKESKEYNMYNNEIIEEKVENIIKNEMINETINEEDKKENLIEDNTIKDDNKNEIEKENKISNSTTETKPEAEQDNGEKAISLVKKEWGENDNTVYYYIEEQVSDSIYIISVRDQNTTEDLSSYKVDVSSESIEKE